MECVESMKDGESGMTVACILTKNVMSVLTLGSLTWIGETQIYKKLNWS